MKRRNSKLIRADVVMDGSKFRAEGSPRDGAYKKLFKKLGNMTKDNLIEGSKKLVEEQHFLGMKL